MATWVGLINWTDQGIRNFRDTLDRAQAARDLGQKLGATLRDTYWTVGPYDIVGIIDAPDEETVTAYLLALGSQGNVRTTTMRAFSEEEVRGILDKLA